MHSHLQATRMMHLFSKKKNNHPKIAGISVNFIALAATIENEQELQEERTYSQSHFLC